MTIVIEMSTRVFALLLLSAADPTAHVHYFMPRHDRYSFDYGAIHFVIMSTEHDFMESSPQYAFIARDLASVDRSKTPWIVFGGHRPMYSATAGYNVGYKARAPLGGRCCARRRGVQQRMMMHNLTTEIQGWHGRLDADCVRAAAGEV